MGLLFPYGLVEGLPLYGAKVVSDAYPVRGRVVLLTDATEGPGPETARRLAARGAKLGLTGADAQALSALAAELGAGASWFDVDPHAAGELEEAVEGVVRRFGALDVVVAHAAWPPMTGSADLREAVQDNLRRTAAALRAGLSRVVERRGYAMRVVPVAALLLDRAGRNEVGALTRDLRATAEPYGAKIGVAWFAAPSTMAAAGAIVRAIERRARRIAVPRRAWAGIIAPALLRAQVEGPRGPGSPSPEAAPRPGRPWRR